MAGKYLTGDGIWTAANFTPATLPGAGDVAIIPRLLKNPVTDPSGNADTADMDGVYVHRGFTEDFGSSGTPIRLAATEVKLFSSGNCYLECDDLGTTGDIDNLHIALGRAGLVAEIGGDPAAPGDIDAMNCMRGRILLKSSIQWPAGGLVNVGFVSNPSDDCFVVIDVSAPTLPVLNAGAGKTTAKNVITTACISGRVIKTDAKISTSYILPGGLLEYEFAEVDTGTLIHVFSGGTLDLLTTSVPKDFGDVFVQPGGVIRYDPAIHTFSGTFGLVDMNQGVLP